MVLDFPENLRLPLFLASYLLVGGKVALRALKNISRGKIFDENFLMALATVGAFALGEYPEGVAVMLFYRIGEAFENYALGRSRRQVSSLMDIRPDYANLKTESGSRRVSPREVPAGSLIIVKPGEKIPLDGFVTEGRSAIDTSALTGEALPRDVEIGSEVLAGCINLNGLLTLKVSREFGESTVSKILNLVENSGNRKAKVENFITKFARVYTPAVVFAAAGLALIPPLVLPEADFSSWLGRALVFLVVSCPCALVISIPLGFFGGIGGASRAGILVKGSNYLDALARVNTVVLDKTGTLTRGDFRVTRIIPARLPKEEILFYAAYAESSSNHPIALSIGKAYTEKALPERISGYEEIAGRGLKANVDGKPVLSGNAKFLEESGIAYEAPSAGEDAGTSVYVAVDGVYAGRIVISDELKPGGRLAAAQLKALGVRKTVMLSGDSRAVAEKTAREAGLDSVYAELLPHEKVQKLEEIEKEKTGDGCLVFVGDGMNDAPVLARADVGIAMGGLGADAAIEAADVVLMTDEPQKIAQAIRIARKTRSIVRENIIFALGVKALILLLGALGMAGMWEAVFGDVGVAVLAILNAMRAGSRSRAH
jgi:Cd2+/Zn2+-exporting ATPase